MVCCKQQTSEKSSLDNNTELATKHLTVPSHCTAEQESLMVATRDHSSNAQPSCYNGNRDSHCIFGNRQLSCSTTGDMATPSTQRESYNNYDATLTNKNHDHSDFLRNTETSETSHMVDKTLGLTKSKTCSDLPEVDPEQPSICIRVKANKKKYAITLQSDWSGATMMKVVSHNLRIPLDQLKLIRQGKQVTVETMGEVVMNKAMFQAIGEEAEDEDGLEAEEIELVMRQATASRNQAVRSLRKTGDVIDAIFDIANK